jgi:hypothetical protein
MKRKLEIFIRLPLFIFLLVLPLYSWAQSVYPTELEGTKVFEIGELILLLMPDKTEASIGWDYRDKSGIRWITDGYNERNQNTSHDQYYRDGIVRVQVQGQKTTVLKKHKLELGWTVSYVNYSNPKFGPEEILITPGNPDKSSEICFGSLYDGCDFDPFKSIVAAGITVQKICHTSGDETIGYQLSYPSKQTTFILWTTSGGSGGTSSDVTVKLLATSSNLCNDDAGAQNALDEMQSPATAAQDNVEEEKRQQQAGAGRVVVYALFICSQRGGMCQMQGGLPDTTYRSLAECEQWARRMSGFKGSPHDGRFPVWNSAIENDMWYECRGKHVDTWEPAR